MNNLNEKSDFWKERTGFATSPERIDNPSSSDAHIAYANYLDQSIVPLVGKSYEDSGAKQAPYRRSYSRVVYGDQNKNNTNSTQVTEVSTITPMTETKNDTILLKKSMNKAVQHMQEEAKKGQQDMRNTLLEEIKQIRQDHSNRATKVEESVEVFEHIVKELHESNKAKSLEMVQYEKKLAQIGSATSRTAAKVDDLAKSMNNKVDKLNLTMKAFINVMADAVCKNGNKFDSNDEQQKHNLMELSKLLEDNTIEQTDDMVMEWSQETNNNKKHKPSPGT